MTPGSDPEIPSLKPLGGKEEEKKGGAALPSTSKPATPSGFKFPGFGGGASTGASKAFSAPNLKVRGLSGGGSTVMDRLKNLRKKDLIFIGAGLCTLGMAPLAEHLLMSPDEQTAKLQEGFNSQQGPLFQDGSSVYEPGNGVGSPGGLVGQGSDVITPLNVRDPSNLIMSPGAQKKADAVVAPPPSSPAPSKGENDWKDVLRDSAKSGAGKAVQQSPKLPKPNAKMAGAIRGLSALGGGGGGTGASLKLDPLSASNVPNKAAGSGALTRSQATPGFRGATSRSGASSGAGEDLRAAGSKQSDIFNRGGGAAAALDAASREAIPAGGSAGGAGGRPGEGGETKNPGGNSQKDNKSLGESLAFLRQKMEMEKSLDLKWEKKKWNQFGRQKMMEESAIKLGFDMFGKFAEKAVIGPLGDFIGQSIIPSGSVSGVNCQTESGPVMLKNSDSGKYRCIGNSAQFFGKDGAPGSKMECSRGCFAIGGGGDGAAPTGNPNADGENPSQVGRVQAPRTPDRASALQGEMQKAFDRYCAPGAAERLSGPDGKSASCEAIAKLKITADVTIPKDIQPKREHAKGFITQGYEKLKASQLELDRGLAALGDITGDKDGKSGGNDAPLLVAQQKFMAAHNDLEGGKNKEAKANLEEAKTNGYEKAVGTGGAADKPADGSALKKAAGFGALALDKSDAAREDLKSAGTTIKQGHDKIDAVLVETRNITPPTNEGGGGAVVSSLKSEVEAQLDALKKDFTALGGASGEDGGLNQTAIGVHKDQIEAARLKTFPTASTKFPGGAVDPKASFTVVKEVVGKAGDILTVIAAPAGGGAAKWVDANPAATPTPITEQDAATANKTELGTKLKDFTEPQGQARVSVGEAGKVSAQAKAKLEACVKAFSSGAPGC